MTSDEIKAELKAGTDNIENAVGRGNYALLDRLHANAPLWEIAYQIAVLNERQERET